MTHGAWQGRLHNQRKDGSTFWVHGAAFLLYDDKKKKPKIVAIARDITKQQQIEEERVRLQQQLIDAQHAAICELSTPLIPISDSTVIMPLIGSIDSARVQQIMEALLEGVAAHKARIALLDITGVQVVDTQVANALVQAAQAVRLLGAQVVLTGIQPQIAQTLVHLAVDLRGIVTRATLQAGIIYALQSGVTY